MINIPIGKIYNSYIIETYDYENAKQSIKNFAVSIGFDDNFVRSDNHPDLLFFESADSQMKIKDLRESIIEPSIYSPKYADKKIYVIYDAVNLMDIGQNAILKTLEEPPAFDIFFLITSNANTLLETIKSRCVTIKDNSEIDFKEILTLDYLPDAIRMLANIKYESISNKISFADNFDGKENSLRPLIMVYRYIIRDAMLYKSTLSKKNLHLKEKEEDIITIANSLTMEEMGKIVQALDNLSEVNRYNVNKKIALFNFYECI